MAKIDSFIGPYRFLSNFYVKEVEYEGKKYPSSEHAYQAAKASSPTAAERIRKAPTPAHAKKMGRQCVVKPLWNNVRVATMYNILLAKFSDPVLRNLLLDTGDAELEEGNTWGDTFWGVCNHQGKNMLGKLLMEVRRELRIHGKPVLSATNGSSMESHTPTKPAVE